MIPRFRLPLKGQESLTIQAPELWSDTDTFKKVELVLRQKDPSPEFMAILPAKKRLRLSAMDDPGSGPSWTGRVWSIDDLPQGDYTLSVAPFGLEYPVTIRPGEVQVVDVTIPPMARTVVELWHQDMPVEDALLFGSVLSGWSTTAAVEESEGSANLQVLTLVSLPGDVRIFADVPGYPPIRETLSVLEGWNYSRIEVVDRPQVLVRAVNAKGEEVAASWWFDVVVSPVNGAGMVVDQSVQSLVNPLPGAPRLSRGKYYFSEPGRYTLQFPSTLEGLQAEDLTVSVDGSSLKLVDVLVQPAQHR